MPSKKSKRDATAAHSRVEPVERQVQQALALHRSGRIEEAQLLYIEVLKRDSKNFDALHMLGVAFLQKGQAHQALEMISEAIAINPSLPESYINRGLARRGTGDRQGALADYHQAITLRPNNANAHLNQGNVLLELKEANAALASFGIAIAHRPEFADAYHGRGIALEMVGDLRGALDAYDRVIEFSPANSSVLCRRGVVLWQLAQWDSARDSFERAIALDSRNAEAYKLYGDLLRERGRSTDALAVYDRALAVAPHLAECHLSRGILLCELKQYPAAIASFDRAKALKPGLEMLCGLRLLAKMQACDWAGLGPDLSDLVIRIERGELASTPFAIVAQTDSAALQRRIAETWVREKVTTRSAPPASWKHVSPDRLRIAYISADFHNHATSQLIAGLLETHDRSRFEITALSFGPESNDDMRLRVQKACDAFIDIRNLADHEVVALCREREIDIAVDLAGFVQRNRAGIFAKRAAPLQVNYLGYPGTMGATFMDYIIADRRLIPEQSQQHYAEKIIYLPDSYQVNDSRRRIGEHHFSRQELGLPPTGFVFCCFNNNYKITPDRFGCWMGILRQVDGSVLWLFQENQTAADNLRRAADQMGVSAERLVFAERLPHADHLARHRAADLFLDTFPCNAHTTASDALWTGLPVLTVPGETFASRVAASLLYALDLPELIAADQDDYAQLAVALATDPMRLGNVRNKLRENRESSPLFDTETITTNLEEAFRVIHNRYLANAPPEHLCL